MVLDAEEAERFLVARDGDSLVCPFQCDVCHFVNVMGREPLVHSATDTRMLKCIRRVMLDAFWAREPTTVGHVLQEARTGLALSTQLGFAHKLFGPRGPFPAQDVDGMAAAIVMVQRSLAKGRYGATVQFETVRKFRAAVSNIYHSSIEGQGAMVMAKDTRKLQVTKCPTYTAFFERFCHGMHKRMGDIVRPERALSHDILRAIMEELERDWETCPDRNKLDLALEGAYYLIAYTLALRGEEVPLVEIRGITKHWEQSTQHVKPHVVITLLGRFKSETGECYHMMPVLCSTPRGLEPKKWIERVLSEYRRRGVDSGFMFRNPDGSKIRNSSMSSRLYDRLESVQASQPRLISRDTDIREEYGVSRSFRRGGTSTATNNGAPPLVTELNGRWRKKEQSGASRPNITVREHYTDVRMVLDQLLEFSRFL